MTNEELQQRIMLLESLYARIDYHFTRGTYDAGAKHYSGDLWERYLDALGSVSGEHDADSLAAVEDFMKSTVI